MKVTYSDGLGMVEVEVDEYGIICDGAFFIFTDTSERDYKIPVTDVYSIVNK